MGILLKIIPFGLSLIFFIVALLLNLVRRTKTDAGLCIIQNEAVLDSSLCYTYEGGYCYQGTKDDKNCTEDSCCTKNYNVSIFVFYLLFAVSFAVGIYTLIV